MSFLLIDFSLVLCGVTDTLFLADFLPQKMLIWIVSIAFICLLLFLIWKLIANLLKKYEYLYHIKECPVPVAENVSEINGGSGIYQTSEVEINEETDPIEEAKIFATYGKYEQAITILQWQIKAFPNETASYLELFNIYRHLDEENAYFELLKSLPFDKNSTEFQEVLKNGLKSFPNSDELKSLEQPNYVHFNIKENLKTKCKAQTNLKVKEKTNIQVKQVKAIEIGLKKQTNRVRNKKQSIKVEKAKELLTLSNKKFTIKSLSSLEYNIFLTFDCELQTGSALKKQKQVYQKQKKIPSNKSKKNKTVLIKINRPQTEKVRSTGADIKKSKVEQAIVKQFNNLLSMQKNEKGVVLLESYLKHNPLLDIFYPMLMRAYIEFSMLEEYYRFRHFIFSHEIQPSIDIILLITDTESLIKSQHYETQQAI